MGHFDEGFVHLCKGGVASSLPPLSNGILQVLGLLPQLLQFVHRAPNPVLFTRQALALPHRLLQAAGYRLGAPTSTPAIPPALVFRPHLKRKEKR